MPEERFNWVVAAWESIYLGGVGLEERFNWEILFASTKNINSQANYSEARIICIV